MNKSDLSSIKNILLSSKPSKAIRLLLMVLFVFLFANVASAQTNTWDGSSNNNWNTAANWSLNLVPTAAHDVRIPNGITTTITINTAAVCSTFTMVGGNRANNVTISGTNSLTVSGTVSIGAGAGNGDNKLINVGTGTLSCASITITATGNSNRTSGVTLSTGTVNVIGNITMGDANDDITFSGAGALNIGGTITGGTLITSTGTVNYNNAGNQNIGNYTYYNLTLSGSGIKTFGEATTITNNFSITSGAIANLGTYTHTAGTLTLGGVTQVPESWGSTSSPADNKNDTYFSSTVGLVNNSCSPPTITSQPLALTICENSGGSFSVLAPGASSYQWQYSTDAGVNWSNTNGVSGFSTHTSASLTLTNIPASYNDYRVRCIVRSSSVCRTNSNSVLLIVSPTSVGGTISGTTTVCAGTNSTVLTLSGHTGTITRWESSLNNFATAGTTIANTTTTLAATNLTATTSYRAVVTSVACAATNSTAATVTVNPALSNNNLTYTNGTSAQVSVTANEGSDAVLNAASGTYFASVNFASYGTPSGTSPNYVTNPSCHAATSQSVAEGYLLGNSTATIPAANGVFGDPCEGTVKRLNVVATYAEPICSGNTIAISGSTPTGGSGTYGYLWESSTTSATSGFAAAAGINNTINYSSGAITQNTWFRRTVTSGVCSTSTVVQIKVSPVIVSNTITAAQTICTGTAPATLTGSTPTGGIGTYAYLWETSTTSAIAGFATASGTNNTINYTPSTLSITTWYRRKVTSGVCSNTSAAIEISVSPISVGGTISGTTTVCAGTNSTVLTLSGHTGTITRWESSLNNFATPGTTIANTTTTLTATNLTATTSYRAVVTSGSCAATNSGSATVTVSPSLSNNNLTYTNGTSAQVIVTTNEGSNAVLNAASGTYFASVNFASYGTPAGTSPNFVVNPSCHAATSQSVTEGYLLGNSTATIPATNSVFGDPCVGTVKKLNVVATYVEPICSGNTITISGSTPTGGSGTYGYLWESSTTSATTGFSAAAGINNTISYLSAAITQNTWFRRTVTSGGCTSTSSVVLIRVTPVIVSNTISAAQTICTGTVPTTLIGSTPTGGIGTYTYLWEISTTSAIAGFATASGTNNTINYTPGTLSVTTWCRRRVTSGVCSNTSTAIEITVSPTSSVSAVSADQVICAGSLPANITIASATGNIQWQRADNALFTTNLTNVGTNSTTLTSAQIGILTSTRFFRAVVTSGSCSDAISGTVIVTVNNTLTITPNKVNETCPSSNNGSISPVLSGGLSNVQYIKLTQKYSDYQQVAEIQAFEIFTGANVALSTSGAVATGSSVWLDSTGPNYIASNVNNGLISGNTFWHSKTNNLNEWVKIDLQSAKNIDYLRIYNRTDCCSTRGQNMLLELFDGSNNLVYSKTIDLFQSGANFTEINVLDVSWADGAPTLNRTALDSGTYTLNSADAVGCSSSSPIVIGATDTTPATPIVGTITQPNCTVSTGSVVLSGLPSGNWTINPGGISGNTSSVTISGLAAGTYNFTASSGSCTSSTTGNVVINATVTNTWNGSAWSNGTPNNTQKLVFTGIYPPTVDPNVDITGCSCMVTGGATVTIKSGITLTITNEVTVVGGGNLTFDYDRTFGANPINSASLIQINNVSNSGNIKYLRRTNTNVISTDYTYWSSPVSSQSLFNLSPNTLPEMFYSYQVTASNEDWKQESSGITMAPGLGYIIGGPKVFTPPDTYLATFTGVPNNGTITLSNVFANKSYLLGNPYPSAIDADLFLNQNATVLGGTLYFWTHNTNLQDRNNISSTAGSGAYAYTSNDYATYNITGGVGIDPGSSTSAALNLGGNSSIPSGKIAAGQGFFASTQVSIPTGSSIVFNNDIRVAGVLSGIKNNAQFFKTKNPESKTSNTIEKHRVWLNLSNTQGAFKQTLIGYITDATNKYDSRFDGESFDGNEFVDFYSINQDKNLVIQGRALPFDENDEIPLGYRTTIKGDFSIKIDQTDGLLSNQNVFIEDKLTNTVFDLKNGNYTFNTAVGTFNDRFVLRFKDKTLGTTDFDVKENTVLVSIKSKQIKINSFAETIDKVTIYDTLGRQIFQRNNVNSNEFSIANLISSHQTLIVKTSLLNGKTVTDKIIY